ncbi:MAG: low molecular weight protein-tyrosine-phosphatase [Sulfuricellaceae bacterium]|nr:low molecular weight protein-tyrosine-phosphatase [Sulfuricellaceae bacterium]
MTKILFVCMGNICRSPAAEGVFRDLVARSGMGVSIQIDSAGTHDYHIGALPDARMRAAALKRGCDLGGLRGRQVGVDDFQQFDHILAMDQANLSNLKQICPPELQHKIRLFLEFSQNFSEREVPDPYYGAQQGFEHVLDLIEDASQGLLASITKNQ